MRAMSYQRGPDRSQVQLLPPCLDDYVGANSPVRFIEVFVEGLDLKQLGFQRAEPAETGRPAYDPADLLKLYLYGYLNRIRSSRRLEGESQRNLELMWLLRTIHPDFKTIADFRKDNRPCFKGVFKQFNLLCRKLDLFGAELVAIDGSKFKAVNNPSRRYTAEQLQELIKKIEERIEAYLQQLDQQDAEAEGVSANPTRQGLEQKLQQLRQRKGQYAHYIAEMKRTGEAEIFRTDAESRSQKRVGAGYNVQVAVDAKHDLIVESQVVQEANDLGQLSGMAQAARDSLGAKNLKIAADAGYHEAVQLERCEAENLETYVPVPGGNKGQTTSGQTKDGQAVYPKQAFAYDAHRDAYRCPAGQELPKAYQCLVKGKTKLYYYNMEACAYCALRQECTTGKYRRIARLANEAVVERQAQRVWAHPELVAQRKTIVEHVFGTLRNWGHDIFLTRGLNSVRAEFVLSALSYNLRRALQVVGTAGLLAAVRTTPSQ
jgi:transposase